MKPLVIYHKNCSDGFGAAFAAWLRFRDSADYLPLAYDDDVPDVTGRSVYMVDVTFDRPVMERVERQACLLVVLDHHKTAVDRLHGMTCRCGLLRFDMAKSGARLAWEYFQNEPAPPLIRHIEDRDLWRFDLPETRSFLAALDMTPRTFEAWEQVLDMDVDAQAVFLQRGAAMNEKFQAMVVESLHDARPFRLDEAEGLVLNAHGLFNSDAGSRLAAQCGTFALVWWLNQQGRVRCSLRSVETFDVERLARRFGGGGHRNSAAFTLSADRLPDLARGVLTSGAAIRTRASVA